MQIAILVILVLLNAFFAAAEIAFISLNDAKVEKKAKDGDKKSQTILRMIKNPSKFLATIQIGITFAGFLSSAFAADTFVVELAPRLYHLIPAISFQTWRTISLVLITVLLSYFTLIFGELVPKRIAMKNYEKIAYGSSSVIKFISIITAPFVKLLTVSTNLVSKIFGVTESEEATVTEEEIRMMVDAGQEKGTIRKDEKEMINNVFELNDRIVSEIMTDRTNVFAVDMNTTIAELIEELEEDRCYSRIPVYDETIDEIQGMVYLKDIITCKKNKNSKIKSLIKEAFFVPETKRIDELFKEFQKNKRQLAIAVDEYGGTAGVVTMEDILEELVGEIYDEYDMPTAKYEKIDENTYLVDGTLSTYEVEKLLDITIPEGDYDTLSGYLFEELGRIPKIKEKPVIETANAVYKIEKFEDNRIVTVKVCKVLPHVEEENEETE